MRTADQDVSGYVIEQGVGLEAPPVFVYLRRVSVAKLRIVGFKVSAYFLARLLEADGAVGFGDATGPIHRYQDVFVYFCHLVAIPAARAAVAATAAGAFGFRPRFVDGESAPIKLGAAESGNGAFRFGVVRHFDKAKSLRLPGIAVSDDAHALNGAVSFEHGPHRIFRGGEAQVSYKDILHGVPFEGVELRITAGVERERIVPDDAIDAKISGPVTTTL